MAFRSVLFIALSAAAVQSVVGWEINGLFGTSGSSISSLPESNSLGAELTIKDGAINGYVQLGPWGGIQSRIVTPVLPQMGDIVKRVQDGIGNISNSVGSFLGVPNLGVGGLSRLFQDLSARIADAQTFIVDGIKTNINGVVQGAGGLLADAVEAGALTSRQIASIAFAFVKSAYENTVNPLASLIDALQKAVQENVLSIETAIQVLGDAVRSNLHMAEGMSNSALNAFLDAATNAQTITKDVADRLRAFINNDAGASSAGISIDTNGDNQ